MLTLINKIIKRIKRKKTDHIGNKKFIHDKKMYVEMNTRSSFAYNKEYEARYIHEWNEEAASIGNYFWQDLWAAKLIHENKPATHYDIGSRVDGFIGHLASFMDDIVLIDIRPLKSDIPGVSFFQDDATNLGNIKDESVESISALCSLEHFGLGRYGDPIDPEACFDAMRSIVRVLKKGGHAYIAVPVGWEHLEFNAHRIFFASTVIESLRPLVLKEFSVASNTEIEYNVDIHKYDNDKNNKGEIFGLFHMIKN